MELPLQDMGRPYPNYPSLQAAHAGLLALGIFLSYL